MSRHFLLTVYISTALLVVSPLSIAGEEQRARSRGGSSSGRVSSGSAKAGRGPSAPKSGHSTAARRRAPGPSGSAIAPGSSKRRGAGGPSAKPPRRNRGGASSVSGAGVTGKSGRDSSRRTPGVNPTPSKSNRITRRTPGQPTQATKVGSVGSVGKPTAQPTGGRQRGRSRIVEVQGASGSGSAATNSGAIRVGSSARRATARSNARVHTPSNTRTRPGPGRDTVTTAHPNRRPGGTVNVTGKAVPRHPIATSPGYGRGRGSKGPGYRTTSSYRYRYPYSGGRTRFGRHYNYGYYPHHYYPHRHYRYPGYVRPAAFGSFFYFPGYGFNLGVGFGYPGAFGSYGYSGYAYYPYVGVGYSSYPNYSDPYTGFLRLKVKPRDAQVFVDGSYVGLVDHFDGFSQRLRLQEGTHRVEIVHPLYVPIEFDVLIVTGEKVTFEENLTPL